MGVSKQEKEKQRLNFKRSDNTVFNNGNFRDFLEQRVGAVINNSRERMLEYENKETTEYTKEDFEGALRKVSRKVKK